MKALDPSTLNLTSSILDYKIKSLYITSPHQGTGTTTCAYSLAKALGSIISKKVILIDGNSGQNSLTEKLKLEDNTLHSYINITDPHKPHGKEIRAIAHEAFHIIPASSPNHPAPVADDRSEMAHLIETIIQHYSYLVIYDAPPIHSDKGSLALAATFDGVLMIVKNNETRIEVANSAKEKLTQAGANVIGAIFNHRRYYVPQWAYDLLY